MTQPAKVQEPSMEEILASIRRIIADDEAKPATAEKPTSPVAPAKPKRPAAAAPPAKPPSRVAPAKPERPVAAAPPAKPPVMNDIPPSAIPAARTAPVKAPPPPAPPPPAPAPSASNSQDDIDSLLNGLDEATTAEEIRQPLPDGDVLELTDEMALPDPPPPSLQSLAAAALRKFCRARPCPRSNPPSIALPTPCSATTHGRWKISSRR